MHTFTIALISTLSLSVYAASIGDSISQLVTREQHNRQFHHNPDFVSDNNLAAESFERSGKKSPREPLASTALGEVVATGNTVPQATTQAPAAEAAAGALVVADNQAAANNPAVANNQAQAAPLIAPAQVAGPPPPVPDLVSLPANNLASLPANNLASAPLVLSNPVRLGATSNSPYVATGAGLDLLLAGSVRAPLDLHGVPMKRQISSLAAPDLSAGTIPTGSLPAAALPTGSVPTSALPMGFAPVNPLIPIPSISQPAKRDDSLVSSNDEDGDMDFSAHEADELVDFEEGL